MSIETLNVANLFELALGVTAPWYVEDLRFDKDAKTLEVKINFKSGSSFHYVSEEEGIDGLFKAYDTVEKRWRHLNFFQHDCHLVCRVPRVNTGKGIRQVRTPWDGVGTGFTLLMEAFILLLAKEMPINAAARIVGEDDERLWRLVDKYVSKALAGRDLSTVTAVGMDETSRDGHDYVSVFVDLDKRETIFATEGKDHTTVAAFAKDLKEHGGDPEKVTAVSCDMSRAFIKGIEGFLPNAKITFDKFHLVKVINKAVDEVRKAEAAGNPLLKKTKYCVLTNSVNRSEKQEEKFEELKKHKLKTVRAVFIRESFQDLYKARSNHHFGQLLDKWLSWAKHCRLEPMKKAAATIEAHKAGVLQWFYSQLSNGILEGLNSLIQSAKNKARGYRKNKNFITIIYLITANLDFSQFNPFIEAK